MGNMKQGITTRNPIAVFLLHLFGYVRIDELQESDCLKFDGRVFKMSFIGAKECRVCVAMDKAGGGQYFKPWHFVKKISQKQYDAFEINDQMYRAVHDGTYVKRIGNG